MLVAQIIVPYLSPLYVPAERYHLCFREAMAALQVALLLGCRPDELRTVHLFVAPEGRA